MCRKHYMSQHHKNRAREYAGKIAIPRRKSGHDLKSLITYTKEESGCLVWKGPMYDFGYGAVTHLGKRYRAHRLSYALANGLNIEDIDNFKVLHSCDNPPCINPAHLRLGDQSENVQDTVNRNRTVRGEEHWGAYLTEDAVREIKIDMVAGIKPASLRKKYDLSVDQYNNIKFEAGWKWVEVPGFQAFRNKPKPVILSKEQVLEVLDDLSIGTSVKNIAQKFNVSIQTIYDIRNGKNQHTRK